MSTSGKYSVNHGRHYENPFKDYYPGKNDELIEEDKKEITDNFKNILEAKCKDFVEEIDRNKREWYSRDDCSVYTGIAGIAQMFYHVGQIFKKSSYTARASELIQMSLEDKRGEKRISYLAGSAGPLALGAILDYETGNEVNSREKIRKLCSSLSRVLGEASNELLYGKVGYLYALLLVNSKIPSRPVEDRIIKQIVEQILKNGKEYSRAHHFSCPLMYQWHEKEYIGGAHGLAGILYILLQAREYLTAAQLEQDLKPSLDYLEQLKFPSGNFPSSRGNDSDKLVHWCHGAPSMTMLFTLAYEVFGEESYLKTAIDCGDVVWSRGLLKKGYSLCHGVSGNAYTFICLYQQTEDPKYLYRACKFAEWCMDYGKNCERSPDRPFSLFEGLAGVIYFLADLCEPKLAKFPAYTL